jgi:FAD/FMN-containing dehydrogenase
MQQPTSSDPLAAFRTEIDGIAQTTDARELRVKSHDFHWYSPLLAEKFADCLAEIVVAPKTEGELLRVASAAARHRLPVTVRGGGTGNYGQSVPLRGGVLLDMTGLDAISSVTTGTMRVQAGARIMSALEAAQKTSQQLMMYPSTLRVATIGGFIAGGFAGIGSVRHGILRESGFIRSMRVVTVEETPRILNLAGAEADKVLHAWGTNGIILDVELALVPLQEWIDCIALFPSYADVMRFGNALLDSDLDTFLLSSVDRRFAPYYRRLQAYFDGSRDAMFAMVKHADVERFFALAGQLGGARSLVMSPQQSEKARLIPVYECAFNHTTLMALKFDRGWTYLQIVMPRPCDPALLDRQVARFGDEVLMHHEFTRHEGKPRIGGLPLLRYRGAERLNQVMREFEADGCVINNPHVGILEDGGRFDVDQQKLAFRRSVDPFGLMNPGKSRSAIS